MLLVVFPSPQENSKTLFPSELNTTPLTPATPGLLVEALLKNKRRDCC
jgi:hypothetical protein